MSDSLVVLALWMLVTVYQAWAWGRAMRRVEAAIASLREQLPRKRVRKPKSVAT